MEEVLLDTFGRIQQRVKDPVAAAILTLETVLHAPQKRTGLTMQEAAEYLGVSQTLIQRMCRSGRLRRRQIGRLVRFDADDLDRIRPRQAPVHPASDLRHFQCSKMRLKG